MIDINVIDASQLDSEDIKILKVLGSGGFGTCYQALYKGQLVAYKKLKNTNNKLAALESFESETHPALFKFKHPNVMRLLAASTQNEQLSTMYVIMEYIEGRSLQSILDDQDETIDFKRRCQFSLDILNGLEYIHQHNIVHLDLKPANVIVDNTGVCKLVDFGCSKCIIREENKATKSHLTGTFAYRAPELFKGQQPSPKADVYSFGICMWHFWSRAFPYSGMNQHAVIFRVVSNKLRPALNSDDLIEPDYINVMKKCWSGNPQDRYTVLEAARMITSMSQ